VARAGGARGHGRQGVQAGARRDSSKLRWKSYELRRWAMAVCELQRQVMVADHGGLRAERDRMNQSPTESSATDVATAPHDDILVVGHDGSLALSMHSVVHGHPSVRVQPAADGVLLRRPGHVRRRPLPAWWVFSCDQALTYVLLASVAATLHASPSSPSAASSSCSGWGSAPSVGRPVFASLAPSRPGSPPPCWPSSPLSTSSGYTAARACLVSMDYSNSFRNLS
jgi:hypothetical protein